MQLIQTLEKPVNGFWDGGAKSCFHWEIDGTPQTDSKGQFVKVGAWDANHWFNVAVGKTEKQTLGNARRRLLAAARKHGLKCTFEYKD